MNGWHRPTSEAATGHWRGIMLELGMPETFLTGRHGPCPICGGTDRFRFDNKEGRGTWICSACGAGDGFQLAERFTGMGFSDVAARIDAIVGNIKPDAPKRQPIQAEDAKRAVREVAALCRPVEPGDLVSTYLESRGLRLPSVPSALRFAPKLRDGEGGIRPAMVASVRDATGKAVTLHRTFLRPDGKGKAEMAAPRKLMPGEMPAGSAVRLAEAGESLGVAEGIETALAASVSKGLPVWACLNAGNLMKFQPPEGVRCLAIFADDDESYTGQAAAFMLARRCVLKHKVEAEVWIAGQVFRLPSGKDWNDVLREMPQPEPDE